MSSDDQSWAKLPRFTGKNFQGWKRQVLVVMKNKGLMGYLTKGTQVKMVTPVIKTGHLEESKDVEQLSGDVRAEVDVQGKVDVKGKMDGKNKKKLAETKDVSCDLSERNETLAQGLLFSALDDHVMGQVQTCKTAADIWKRLLLIYENASEINVDRLLQEYYSYIKIAQEDMASHISKVEAMADQLGSLGEPQSERSVISKLLNSLPKEYDAFRNAWDSTHPEYKTKDELIMRLMKLDVQNPQISKDANKDVAMVVQNDDQMRRKPRVKCYNCGQLGHIQRDCRKPRREDVQSGRGSCGCSHGHGSGNDGSGSKGAYGLTLTHSLVSLGLMVNQSGNWTSDRFIVDSGASRHVTPRRDFFETYRPYNMEMQAANYGTIKAIGVGNVKLKCKNGGTSTELTLYDVLHIPDVSHNLFSVCLATKNGANVSFFKWGCKITVDGQLVAVGKTSEDCPVPILQADTQINKALAVQVKRPLADWHNSLGHADHRVIAEMASNKCVDGLEIAKQDDHECTVCPMGKGTRTSHTMESSFKPTHVGERVDFDLIGPLPVPSLGNARYILLTKDKFSGYSHVYVMKSKDETCDKLTEFLSQFEHDSGHRVRAVQTDNGSEFVNENVRRLFAVEHVDFRTSAPYTPEQNGTAERNNRVIIETVRTLVAQGGLPSKLWAEAANTAVFLRNIIPKKGMTKTPFELFRGRRPFVGHIVPFGTYVQSLINDRRLGKFDPKTEPGIIVGFTPRMNTYRVYLPSKDAVKVTCDVVLKDHHLFTKDNLNVDAIIPRGRPGDGVGVGLKGESADDTPSGRPPTSERRHILSDFFNDFHDQCRVDDQDTCWHSASSQASMDVQNPSLSNIEIDHELGRQNQIIDITNRSSSVTGPPILESHEIESNDTSGTIPGDPPSNSHNCADSLRDHAHPAITHGQMNSLLVLANETSMIDEPQTFQEAITGPNSSSWKQAIEAEIEAHDLNKTWEVVGRPDSGTTLTAKWIFKIKRDPEGRPQRFKARLVARGYKQKAGIDYVETFAPVAKMDSIRTLIAIAAARGLCIEQFDISTAFLNGDITDDIFIESPEGIQTSKGECLKLRKALYGLKQAPRVWNSKFDQELKKLDFKPLKTDPCVYISANSDVHLGIYVDDGIIISKSRDKCLDVIDQLNQVFSVKRVNGNTFLGIDIIESHNGLFLSQKRYIHDVLRRFKMDQCKAKSAPMNDVNSLFVKDSDVLTDIPYREAIGSLLYCAMLTRPDILYPTVLLSRFSNEPELKHWTSIKDLLRYLKGTDEVGMLYKRTSSELLAINAYTDADWAGDVRDRKSTTGLIITIAGSPVIFASRQQPVVALSSTEAEFVASCETTKELMWLTSFLKELQVVHSKPVMHIDNRSTIRMVKNNEMQRRTKHIDIKFHFVRDQYLDGQFDLQSIDTEEQLADFLTKALSGPKLAQLLSKVNVGGRPP